jgi:hypothetical protein
MRHCKYLLIVAVVAVGYWTGYAMRRDRPAEAKPAVDPPAAVVVAPMDPTPPAIDPILILPPVPDRGAMIDIPIDDIRKQFRDKAGLKQKEEVIDLTKMLLPGDRGGFEEFDLTKCVPIPFRRDGKSSPPQPEPKTLPPVIRLPAPPDEPPPTLHPTVKRVVHRQLANWMFVNERDLRLNFDITKRGSSGIKAVELWARRSSDHDYDCVDRMIGDKPPFMTRLWSEGTYEFRLVFEGGSGERTRTPTRNDLPDLYVCLDTTSPVVELLPPSTDETGVVMLRWKASDRNLEEQPICLHYSVDGKTWEPLDGKENWLPNTGTYAWKVPAGLPHEVHLRVQARDRAGNVGEARSPGKFSVDLVMPDGRISGVVEKGPEPRVTQEESAKVRVLAEYVPIRNRNEVDLVIPDVPPHNLEQLPLPREMQSDREQLPMPRQATASEHSWLPPRWPVFRDSANSIAANNAVAREHNWYANADEYCEWLLSQKATPCGHTTKRPPATIFDGNESVYQRAKGYVPTRFARLPAKTEALLSTFNRYFASLTTRGGCVPRTPGYGNWSGGIEEELLPDPWDERYSEPPPMSPSTWVVPAPRSPDPYLSDGHASFLEQLTPVPSQTFEVIPYEQRFIF